MLPALRVRTVREAPWVATLLLAAWGISHAVTLRYLGEGLSAPIHEPQRIFMLFAAWATWFSLARGQLRVLRASALAFPLLALGADLVARAWTDIRTVHAVTGLLLLAATTSAVLLPRAGERRWPLWLGILLALPVQPHLDAHVGVPLRLWTADTAAALLGALGTSAVRVETVLLMDHGATDVANACSGVRTLEHVTLAWCALAWWRRGAEGWRLPLSWAVGAFAAVMLNVVRVTVLAAWGPAHVSHPLGDAVHAWLGLVTWAVAGLLVLAILRGPRVHVESTAAVPSPSSHPAWTWTAVGMLVLPLAVFPAWAVESATTLGPFKVPGHDCVDLPLNAGEQRLAQRDDGTALHKRRCTRGVDVFDVVVVTSPGVRAQHAPELCLMAAGHAVHGEEMRSGAHGPWRVLSVGEPRVEALTWFQDAEQSVAGLGQRARAAWRAPRDTWALVTVVPQQPLAFDLQQQLHGLLFASVRSHLRGEP